MPALATVADLAAFCGWAGSDAQARLAIDVATGVVQRACAQTLLPVVGDVVTLAGGQPTLILPERPVTAVSGVAGYDSGAWRWDGRDMLMLTAGAVWSATVTSHAWMVWPDTVTVTYSHGFTSIPADLKGVCLTVATRLLDNPSGVRAETVAGYSATYGDAAGISLTATERAVCNTYRRRTTALRVSA